MKAFNPKAIVAKAMKASNSAKNQTLRNRRIKTLAEANNFSHARAEVELWLKESLENA